MSTTSEELQRKVLSIDYRKWMANQDANKSVSIPELTSQICTQHDLKPDTVFSCTPADVIALMLSCQPKMSERVHEQEATESFSSAETQHQDRCQVIAPVILEVLSRGLLSETSPAIDVFNMDQFQARCEELIEAFDAQLETSETQIIHAAAVKANPIRGILKVVQGYPSMGAECASFPEAKHALSLGFTPRHIIFDTPCKSKDELIEILHDGCYVNLDNLEEIQTLAMIVKECPDVLDLANIQNQIGLRLNPVVGGGSIACTSTATASSKFGLPLTSETEDELLAIFQNHAWLQGVHCHVGSQGCTLDQLVKGARRTVDFALRVNATVGKTQIGTVDIGGGLPTQYDGLSAEPFCYRDYAQALKNAVPELFNGQHFHTLLTEFGRSLFVKSGVTLSKVEAVKHSQGQVPTAVVHVGANQFLRTAYLPAQWPHALSVFTASGELKKAKDFEIQAQNVCGPMCFSGDFLAKNRLLPSIEARDIVVVHDTGGYTTAMYSKYNSRRASAMYAYQYSTKDNEWTFKELKARETCEETLAFWGHEEPPIVPKA